MPSLLNIFCFCFRSLPFLSFIVPILAWNVHLISPVFLKRSLVFPILLFSSISLNCSLKRAFLSLLAIFWNSAFNWVYLSLSPLPFTSLFFLRFCKAFWNNHFDFLHFFYFGMLLVTASYTVLWTSVHSSSGTLLDLIPWIYSLLYLYNHKGFDLGNTWMTYSGFLYLLQFNPEFCHKEFMIWDTVSSRSCFYWLYKASPFLAAIT